MLKKIIQILSTTKKLDFIIIGAQKSGTTSLHNYLDKHPDIFMSKPFKEPRYFMPFSFVKKYYKEQKNPIYLKSKNDLLENYMLKNYNRETIFGESSTDYTLGDRAYLYGIPKKIYKHNKNIKLIYVLRDPFERLYSNYRHDQNKGRCDGLSFGSYLIEQENDLMKTSLYYYQIKQYLNYFPKVNVLLLSFDELAHETDKTLKKVFDFMGINADRYTFQGKYETYNKGTESQGENYRLFFNENNRIYEKIKRDQAMLHNEFDLEIIRKNSEYS